MRMERRTERKVVKRTENGQVAEIGIHNIIQN